MTGLDWIAVIVLGAAVLCGPAAVIAGRVEKIRARQRRSEFDRQLLLMQQSTTRMAEQIGAELLPSVTEFARKLAEVLDELGIGRTAAPPARPPRLPDKDPQWLYGAVDGVRRQRLRAAPPPIDPYEPGRGNGARGWRP